MVAGQQLYRRGPNGNGYLWIDTYGRQLDFNGVEFKTIPQATLFQKSVSTMLLDQHGRLWLWFDAGAVICLNSNSDRTFENAKGLPTDRIAAIAENRKGAISKQDSSKCSYTAFGS